MDIIAVYKDQLKIKENEIDDIFKKITPLNQKIEILKKEMEALKLLIGSDKKIEFQPSMVQGRFSNMTGMDVYRELAKNHFKDNSFRETEIRKIARSDGLTVRGKLISRNTSWGTIKALHSEGFLERVDKGLYRFKNPRRIEEDWDLENKKDSAPHMDEAESNVETGDVPERLKGSDL